jgi:anti-sigma-K factor RskA
MSDARPETPEEMRMLAGEYVLGVLGGAEMRAVNEQAGTDPQLAGAIARWERQLGPMLTAVAEVAPPDDLWARIERAKSRASDGRQNGKAALRLASVSAVVAGPPAEPAWRRPVAAHRVWPWKAATGASLALAAGLAAIILMPSLAPQPKPPMAGGRDVSLVAVLALPESRPEARQDASPQMASDIGTARLVEPSPALPDPQPAAERVAGFFAAAWNDGTIVLTAFGPVQVAGGKALELWMQPPDATAPKSLGVLPASGRLATLPSMPANGTALFVSLEPAGGSPSGAPTGHIAFVGTLRQVRR